MTKKSRHMQMQSEGIHDMVLQIGNICTKACREPEEEFVRINNAISGMENIDKIESYNPDIP
jgi:hypothetical protein